MKDAGIVIWVLTGDKIETAVNIGYSCGLLKQNMVEIVVEEESTKGLEKALGENINTIKTKCTKSNELALIINGASLAKISQNNTLKLLFQELCDRSNVVLACRVSPKQKADLVKLVKDRYKGKTTLAIGDGANDVNMIAEAHIGIGISGKEGQ